MSERIFSSSQMAMLYREGDEWKMIKLHKSMCDSFYFVPGSYDILHDCEIVRNLLKKYKITTVVYDDIHVILIRAGNAEKINALIADQQKIYDNYCLQNNNVGKSFYLPDHLG